MKHSYISLLMVSLLVIPISNLYAIRFEIANDQGANHSLTILEATIDAENLVDEDEIGVFTPGGVCAGAEVIEGEGSFGIAVYADNPASEELDGFLTNQSFSFKIWDASEEMEYEAHARFLDGPRTWGVNGLTRIERLFFYTEPIPVIQPATYTYDFGVVGEDHSLDWQLIIENIGFSTLTIDNISINEDAFETGFEDDIEIEPGETSILTVVFTPDAEGEFNGILLIESDDPEYGDLEIELSGSGTNDIEPAISLSEEGYDFGDWAIELSNTWALRITNTGTDSLTIENIEIEDGAFSIDWGGALKIGPHRTYRLVVTFEPTNEEAYESDLTISSDDPNNGELTIPIRGNGIDWEFHFYHPGVQEQWHFLLSLETLLNGEYLNVGDEIGVFTPEGNCGGMRAITENADPEGMIGITTYGDNDSTDFVEGFRDGEEWHFILWDVSTGVETIADIEYDDDEQPQEWHNERLTAVRLSGESDPVPEISVSTADIDFGEIAANLTSEREINITNNGAGELHVTNIATVEDDYFYTDIEVGFVLASEESRAITLTFEPDDVANYEAELHVFSNSPRNGEIVIALSGSGTEPPQTIEVEENPHDFGVIEIENQAVWTMVMINTGWSDLRIDRIEIDNDAYSHNFENAEVLGRDETHEVEVTFAPDQEGNFDTILTIFSDDPENGEFPVTLLGEGGVVPAIEIVPENIDFGNVTVDEVLARRFTINSRGSGDLTVTDISVVGQGFSVNFEDDFVLSPDESQLIPVYFTPEDDRDYNAEVIVTSDDQNNGEVSVGVSGSGEMLPQDITLRYVADEEYGVEFEIQDVDADVQAGTRGVRAVDIDDDGDTDVIGAHRTHVSWWENDGDQNFDVHLINDDVNRAYWVEFADVDLDGDMDILSAADAQEDDGITWWENDGDQNFAEHSIEGGFSSKSIFGIDIDNDNDIDIVASDYDGDQVSWWENDGLGDFTKHSLVEDWDRPYMVYPIDLDEDGDIDVVASATGARRIVWFRNNGDQSFTLVDIAGIDAQGIYVCDIDSDDDLDVVAADSDGAQVEWFENDGNEDFTRHVIMEDFEYAQSVWADDFDDDGDMDIVAGHQRSPYIAYFENDGEENFSLTDISQGLSGNPVSLYSSDIDSDGDADILCSDNSDRFAWWENQFEVSHDFGEVEFDAPDTWSFVIANVGDQVLRITDITPDPNDGIYTTDFDGQIDIDPGETTEIEVIFHPDAEGVFNCTLNIDSDDPDEETLTVTLTGIGDPGQRDPVIPNPIEDIQLAEDFDPLTVANLNLVFSDPDGDDLTFDVFTDDENFIAQIVDDTLLVFDSADDWNGNVLVTVVADDGVARDDDSRAVRQLRFVARSNSQSGDQMMLNEGLTGLSEAHPRRDASAEDTVEVTVTPVNDDPEWVDFPEDTITVAEGDTIEFSVTGADIDNDADELSIEYLIPEGAQFQDNSNGTGDFTWQTSDDSEGDYTVRLILSDPDELTDTVWVNISVGHVNHDPELTAIGSKSVNENEELTFTLEATDIDDDNLVFSAADLPLGAELNGADFTWTPSFDQAGDYDVTFIVTDDGEGEHSDQETITITVNNVNRPPVIEVVEDRTVGEGDTIRIELSADDPDGDEIIFSLDEEFPEGAQLEANVFTWIINHDQAGIYDFTFRATDDDEEQSLSDSTEVTITVVDVNQPPVLFGIGDQEVDENTELRFTLEAEDLDDDGLTFSEENLPEGAELNGANFRWTPTYEQSGFYDVTFIVTDDGVGELTDDETITITVGNVNRAPVLTAIGNQPVNEEEELAFSLEAYDPDDDYFFFIAYDLPEGATLDGAEFSWTPTAEQADNYDVTFRVYDDGEPELYDEEVVTISVGDVNRAPNFDEIDNQEVNEEQLLQFTVSATDLDDDNLEIDSTDDDLPEGWAFVDNGDGTGDFEWTPGYEDSGEYQVTFRVKDDGEGNLFDEVTITITVHHVNRRPVLENIYNQDVDTGDELAITLEATDPDDDGLTFSDEGLPEGAQRNGAEFTWTPDVNQAGEHIVTFIVTDDGPGNLTDEETITITVHEANVTPRWDNPPELINVEEEDLIEFSFSGSDPNGDDFEVTFNPDGLPANYDYSHDGEGTVSFSWQTDLDDGGVYYPIFIISDEEFSDSAVVEIRVGEVNRPPEWVNWPDDIVSGEGEEIAFALTGSDLDEDELTITYSSDNIPEEEETFVDNQDGTADFSWTPGYEAVGLYEARFYISDGIDSALVTVTIIVNDVNRAPEWTEYPQQPVTADEGAEVTFTVEGEDLDGDQLTIDFNSDDLPDELFSDLDNGFGRFTWQTNNDDAGDYTVRLILSDDELTDTIWVDISIGNVNREPRWVSFPDPIDVDETALIEFLIVADDLDNDGLTLDASSENLPEDWNYNDNGNGTGTFSWQTGDGDEGEYTVTFTVSDDIAEIDSTLDIKVNFVNNPPEWTDIPNAEHVNLGEEMQFDVAGIDPDEDDELTIYYTSEDIPDNANFDDHRDGTGTFTWQTTDEDEGDYIASFTLSDGEAGDYHDVIITVGNVNQPPVWVNVPDAMTVDEGALIEFTLVASDPDDEIPEFSFSEVGWPDDAVLDDNDDGTADFTWQTTLDDDGEYSLTFIVSDDSFSVPTSLSITLNDVNQAPEWTMAPGNINVEEGSLIEFQLRGVDPNGDIINMAYDSDDLPDDADFRILGNGVGLFRWQTESGDDGEYSALFSMSDDEFTVDSLIFITVTIGNRPPELEEIGDKGVAEGEELVINLSADDPNDDELSYSAEGFPNGSVLNDDQFRWTPDYDQAGEYNVTFRVTDNGEPQLSDEETIVITVTNTNREPVWANPIAEDEEYETGTLEFTLVGSDADDDDVQLRMESDELPQEAVFTDMGEGIGEFEWETTNDDAGIYHATFIISDNDLESQTEIEITVIDVNREPVWEEFPNDDPSIDENETLRFDLVGSDPDGDEVAINIDRGNLPDGFVFNYVGNGNGYFRWRPTYDESGVYRISFILSDEFEDVERELVITVNHVNRPPIWTDVPDPPEVDEDEFINFVIRGNDPDGDELTIDYSSDDLPNDVQFTDAGSGIGVFTWQTTFDDSGSYTATFTLSDGDSNVVVDLDIEVFDVNRKPYWLYVPNNVPGYEDSEVEFTIMAADPEEDDLTITYESDDLPFGVNFTDNNDGSADFSWITNFNDEGVYTASFIVSDGNLSDTAEVTITIYESNRAPIWIDVPVRVDGNEGESISFDITADDPDGDELTLSLDMENLPEDIDFEDNNDGTGSLNWDPTFEDADQYLFVFTASDRVYDVDTRVLVVVAEVNRPPVWTQQAPRQIQMPEDELLEFRLEGEDADGDNLTITMESFDLPIEAELNAIENGHSVFTWDVSFEDAGEYDVTFIISDGIDDVESDVSITVFDVNQPPQWVNPPEVVGADEDELLVFTLVAVDNDGDDMSITYSSDDVPEAAQFTDHEDGTCTFEWLTTFADSGSYSADFTVSDGDLDTRTTVTILIDNINNPPVWDDIPESVEVNEGDLIRFTVSGHDPEDADLEIQYDSVDLPFVVEFNDHHDGSATFTWQTTYGDEGEYLAVLTLLDDLYDVPEIVTITVNNLNRPPYWDDEVASVVRADEGDLIEFDIVGVDPDGDELSIVYQTHFLPDEAEFASDGGNGNFSWQTGFEDAGDNYVLFLRLSDGDFNVDRQIRIFVGGGNRPPEWVEEQVDIQIDEGELVEFTISASDPDGDDLTIDIIDDDNIGDFELVDNHDGSADFSWRAEYFGDGEFTITFRASDGVNEIETDVTITVNDVNQPPYWSVRPNNLTIVGYADEALTVLLSAVDPDNMESLEINWEYVGVQPGDPEVIFEVADDVTLFGIMPNRFEFGDYHVRVFASDDEFEISLELTFEVLVDHFVYQETGREHTIRINSLDHFGEELRRDEPNEFDEIGIFTPDGINAGAYRFGGDIEMPLVFTAWGDNPNTEDIEGFRTGEDFLFTYWDYNAGEEYDMNARITAGNREWQNNGFSIVELFIGHALIVDPVTYDFGYVPTEIDDPGDSVFVDITLTNTGTVPIEGLRLVIDGEGFIFDDHPIDIGVNEEAHSDIYFAPQRHGTHEATLSVMLGQLELASVELTGFGIEMGHFEYAITQTVHKIDVIQAIIGDVLNMAGRELEPGEEIGVFTPDDLCAGAAIVGEDTPYEILAFVDDTITFDVDGFLPDEEFHFKFFNAAGDSDEIDATATYITGGNTWQEDGQSVVTLTNLGSHYDPIITDRRHRITVLSVDLFGNEMDEGDDVAAVTPQGLVAGSLRRFPPENSIVFYAYGDDPDTEDIIEGFRDGENIYFVIWDDSAEQEYHARVEWVEESPERWEEDGVSRVNLTAVQDEDNNAPTFRLVDDVNVDEGVEIDFVIRTSDVDDDPISISLIGVNLPPVDFEDLGNGIGSFIWQTEADQAGRYNALFRAYDGFVETRYNVPILIRQVNFPPVLAEIGVFDVVETEQLVVVLEADDPDNDEMMFSAEDMPFGATLTGGVFRWTPNYNQAGEHLVTFRVTDFGQPALSDEEQVTIFVHEANRPPVWDEIDPITVYEGTLIWQYVYAEDPDGDENLNYDSFDLPAGSEFILDEEDYLFFWQTDFESAGRYNPSFIVIDGQDAADTLTLDITVMNTNRMPILDHVDDQQVVAGNSIQFEVSAQDADPEDEDGLELRIINSPPGISIEDLNAGSWLVTWAPEQHGVFSTTRIRVVDPHGGWDDQGVIFTALASDNTPPVITGLQPRNEEAIPFNRPAVRASITDEGSGIEHIEMVFDDEDIDNYTFNTRTGALIWVPEDELEDGDHTYTISAVDMADNRTTVNIVFVISTDPGDIEVDDDVIYTAYDLINLSGTAVPFREMELWLDDELVGEVDSDYRGRFTFEDVSLLQELNTFEIREHRGLLDAVELMVYLDIEAPGIDLTYPGQYLDDTTPRIRADISDAGVGVDDENGIFLSIDGDEITEFGFNGGVLTYNVQDALEEGVHVVSVQAVDLLGNTTEDAIDFEFIVDSRPPMVDHAFFRAPTDTIDNRQPELNIAINDPYPSSGIVGYDIVLTVDDEELDYDWYDVENALYYNFEWGDPLEAGLHRIVIDVYDRAQNSIRSSGSFFIADVNDRTGPEFTNMSPPESSVAGMGDGEDGPLQVRFAADTVSFVISDRDAGVNWNTLFLRVISLNDFNNDNDNDTLEYDAGDLVVNENSGMVQAPIILPDPDREGMPGDMSQEISEGVIQVEVFGEDDEGNEGSDSWQFFFDANPPEIPTLTEIEDYYVNIAQVSISGATGSDDPEYEDGYDNEPAIRIYRNGSLVAEVWTEYDSDFTVENVLLVEGENIIEAAVVDAGGNESDFSDPDTLFLDLTYPEISGLTTPRGPYISDITPEFSVFMRDVGTEIVLETIRFTIDQDLEIDQWEWNLDTGFLFSVPEEDELEDGRHIAELRVADMAGNESISTYRFEIILPPVEPPEFTLTPYTSNNRVSLRGTWDLGEDVVVFLNNRAIGLAVDDGDFLDFNHFKFNYTAGELPDTSWIKLIAVSDDSVESDTTEAQMLLIDTDPPVFSYNDPENATIVDVWELDTVAVLVSDAAAGLNTDSFTMSLRGNAIQFRTTETDSGHWIIADVDAVEFINNESFQVIVTAEDMSLAPNTGQMRWQFVTRVGASPIVFMPDTSFNEDEEFAANLFQFISDEDHARDELALSAELIQNIDNAELVLDDDGVMRITPVADWFGRLSIVVSVEDPDEQIGIDTVFVYVLSVNDVPVFAEIEDGTAFEGRWFQLMVSAVDVDPADNLTFSDNTDFFDIQAGGLITFRPTRAMVGLHEIGLTVQDEAGARDETTFMLEIVAVNGDIDRRADIDDIVMDEDADAVVVDDLDDIFSDPDGDPLAFSFELDPDDAGLIVDIEAGTNIVTIEPVLDYYGEVTVTIIADDRFGSQVDVEFLVTVNPISDPPGQIQDLALNFAIQEDYGTFVIADLDTVFVDPDGDELYYYFGMNEGEHLGLDIDEDNVFSLRPDDDWSDVESFTLYISDEGIPEGGPVRDLRSSRGSANYSSIAGMSFSSSNPRRDETIERHFTVEVTALNDAPRIADPIEDQEYDEDTGPWEVANLLETFEEVDGENLSFRLPVPLPSPLTYGTDGGILRLFAPENYNGEQIELVVEAEDESGLSISDTFYVDILSINDPPTVIGAIGDIEVNEDVGRPWFIADLDDVFEDVDGDSLFFDVNIDVISAPDFQDISWEIVGDNVLEFSVGDDYNVEAIVTVFADDRHNPPINTSFNPTRELRSISRDVGPVRHLRSTMINKNVCLTEPRRDEEISDTFTFTINPVNDLPHWTEVDFVFDGAEASEIDLPLIAVDADLVFGDHLTLSVINDDGVFIKGAVFNDNGDGTGDFIWTPGFDDEGEYNVIFRVSDLSGAIDFLEVLFRIGNLNRPLINDLHIGAEQFTEDDPERLIGNMSDYFIDPDGDPIDYNIQEPDGIITRLMSNDSLYVQPEPNWNGNAEVIIIASDGLSLIYDTLHVSVSAVNDPPTAFNLLSPVDSFFVHSYPLVEFDWEESVDIVEDSAVVYDLSISFDDSVYSWSGLDDEFKIMPRTFFVIDPDMPTEVSWWVFATDGADTVYSADTASVMIAPIRTQITRTPLIPDKYALGRPYPNPFNNMVSVLVDLPDPSWVKLEVYDLTGGLVASLMNEDLNAGRHLANWNGYTHTGRKAASGSYVVRLRSSMGIKTQRVMLLR